MLCVKTSKALYPYKYSKSNISYISTWNLISDCFTQGIQQLELFNRSWIFVILFAKHISTFSEISGRHRFAVIPMLCNSSIFGVWNSSNTFEEYIPNFMKTSRCVQDECAHMITEILSLSKHIRSCQYLPNIHIVKKMDELQKLNTDLMSI